MRIERVTMANFGPYDYFEKELTNGLIGIFGRNGAGKSTFVNGVYAALTNDFTRFPGTKAECIFDGAGPKDKSYIEIDAEHEGTHFTLRRSLRPNKSALIINGEKEVTKATEIELRLRDDLGVDMKLIDTYVFVNQWQMFQFLNNTKSQRAEAYKHLCGTEKADKIFDALGNVANANKLAEDFYDNSDELITAISDLQDEIEKRIEQAAEQHKLELSDKNKTIAKKIVKQREDHDEAVEDLKGVQDSLSQLQDKCEKGQKVTQRREAALETLRAELKELEPDKDKAQVALKTWKSYEKNKQDREKAEETITNSQQKLRSKKPPKQPKGYGEIKQKRKDCQKVENELETLNEIVSNFDDADSCSECPTCHQEVSEEFVEECREKAEQLQEQLDKLTEFIEQCDQYDQDLEAHDKAVEKLNTAISTAEQTLTSLQELDEPEGDKASLESTVANYTSLQSQIDTDTEELNKKLNALSKYQGQLATTQTQFDNLNTKIKNNKVSDSKFDKAKRRLKEDEDARVRAAEIEAVIEEKENQQQDKRDALEKLRVVKKRRRKLDQLMQTLGRVREAFHWNSLPRMVAQGNLVNMEEDINDTLSWFGNPFWVEASEDLGFQVHLPGNNNPRDAQWLSGGQKGVLAISFRSGVNSLFGADIGMMWLDEPTAGLDEQNVSYFEEALLKLAAQVRGKRQLVIITHATALKPAFDQVIEIG